MSDTKKIKAYELIEDGTYSHVETVYVTPDCINPTLLVFKSFTEAKQALRDKVNFNLEAWRQASSGADALTKKMVDVVWDNYAREKAGLPLNNFTIDTKFNYNGFSYKVISVGENQSRCVIETLSHKGTQTYIHNNFINANCKDDVPFNGTTDVKAEFAASDLNNQESEVLGYVERDIQSCTGNQFGFTEDVVATMIKDDAGYSKAAIAGLLSSLQKKEYIGIYEPDGDSVAHQVLLGKKFGKTFPEREDFFEYYDEL